jgi:hypothetical protein
VQHFQRCPSGACHARRRALGRALLRVGAALGVATAVPASAADHVLLNANFNNETVGAAPGSGGAAVGEPIGGSGAIIGLAPFGTPNLQLQKTAAGGALMVFGFLSDEEVTSGTVQIRAQVLFSGTAQPTIGLREQGSYSQTFLNLYTGDNQTVIAAYTGNTFHPGLGNLTPNAIVALEIDASADQKLVSVRLNGIALLDRASIDLTTARGIGMILFEAGGAAADVSSDVMRVDNLRAVACASAVFSDCLFVDGFDQ